MKTMIAIQALKNDRTEYRMIGLVNKSVECINITDTTFMYREEAWVSDSKAYTGRNRRKIFNSLLKDKRYENLIYKESNFADSKLMKILHDLAFPLKTPADTFDEETYALWEEEITRALNHKEGKLENHQNNADDATPF